jgi:hypothetical protein
MEPLDEDIQRRSREYAEQHALRYERRLGFGKDGTVWSTHRQTAVKVFGRQDPLRREAAAYQRLAERGVLDVRGHAVPQVMIVDTTLLVIEMTIVMPPFVLDFASAFLDDEAPIYPDDVLAEWVEGKRDEFGVHWPRASLVLASLRGLGIHMTDVHLGNIGFRIEEP